jgi:hypothetical protein
MAGQFVYTIVTMAPSTIWLYDSKILSVFWILTFFSVSVWNGASFYFKVMANYKEVAALKKELDDLQKVANGTKTPGSTVSSPSNGGGSLQDIPGDVQLGPSAVDNSAAASPMLHPTSTSGNNSQDSSSPEKIPLMSLDKEDRDEGRSGGHGERVPSSSESDSSAVVVEAEDAKASSAEQKKDV